jgi:LmbE family N-acetylglucosaminyl deacetylase
MRILAIGCHPDDLEINCFGTLAKFVKRGDEVYICGVTNGDQGHYRILPEELAKIRYKEAKAAAETIGAKEYYNLGVHDVLVSRYDMVALHKLIDYIRKVNPDAIITQSPDDYMMDHVEASALVFRAAFMATLPHYCTKEGVYPETVPSDIPIYYMSADSVNKFTGTDYVDITEEMEIKLKAMSCHKSQLEWLAEHDGMSTLDYIKSLGAVFGTLSCVQYAEAFKMCDHAQRGTAKSILPK